MIDDTGATAQVPRREPGRRQRCASAALTASASTSRACTPHSSWRTDVPGCLAALTEPARLCPREHRFLPHLPHRSGRPGLSVFETDGAPDDTVIPMLRKLDNVDYATFIELPGSASSLSPGVSAKEIFDDGEQLLDACAELGLNIGAVMAVREARLTGEAHAVAAMRRVLDVMREETTTPSSIRSARSAGLSAARLNSSMQPAATI